MQAGERQVAPTLDGIRKDHRARYEWVAHVFSQRLGSGYPYRMVDVGCGIGYGSAMLAIAHPSFRVKGFDVDAEAIGYAREHYAVPGADFTCAAAGDWLKADHCDAAICFEMIEHLEDPVPLLIGLREVTGELFTSVPNEEQFPYRNYKFHFRHYTRAEFDELLRTCGWRVVERFGQVGPESDVEKDVNGRTYVVRAIRDHSMDLPEVTGEKWPTTKKASVTPIVPHGAGGEGVQIHVDGRNSVSLTDAMDMAFRVLRETTRAPDPIEAIAPNHVCILGMGPSLHSYLLNARSAGGRHEIADEIWGVNALGDVLQCDRVFHMDDVRIQEIRAAAAPDSNIANMVKWLKTHPGPVYTSISHPDYPGLVAYPLEDVLNSTGQIYFNSTVAYAVALAVHIGVKKLTFYGCDYTYPDAHQAEKGRACLEYWMGFARARGIQIRVCENSTLLDAREPFANRLYGYDAVDVSNSGKMAMGEFKLVFTPKDRLPTAAEIEERYNHDRHPNTLVEEGG